MKILEFNFELGAGLGGGQPLSERDEAPSGAVIPRSPGPHVSDIIRDIANTVIMPGKRKPWEDMSKEEQRRLGNYASVGLVWEWVLESAFKMHWYQAARYSRPGQLKLDGITGSPDWVDTEDWAVEEFKATWRSSRRDLETDFWPWMQQIRAYCKLLNTTTARLRVFWVNGDYRKSGPQAKCYQLQFTENEIEDTWGMLVGHAREKGWIAKKKGK